MFGIVLNILVFSACMAIKGGWLSRIPQWHKVKNSNKYYDAILDGSIISSMIMCAYINPIFGVFWFLANSPAMRDPGGPDWKLAVLRGIFTGACLTFATGLYGDANIWFILFGATMPIWYRLALKITKGNNWAYAEPAWGAILGLVK